MDRNRHVTDVAFGDFRCSNCHKKLLWGSLELLVSKKSDNVDSISVKCERCGKIKGFAYEPDQKVVNGPVTSLFDRPDVQPVSARSLPAPDPVGPSLGAAAPGP